RTSAFARLDVKLVEDDSWARGHGLAPSIGWYDIAGLEVPPKPRIQGDASCSRMLRSRPSPASARPPKGPCLLFGPPARTVADRPLHRPRCRGGHLLGNISGQQPSRSKWGRSSSWQLDGIATEAEERACWSSRRTNRPQSWTTRAPAAIRQGGLSTSRCPRPSAAPGKIVETDALVGGQSAQPGRRDIEQHIVTATDGYSGGRRGQALVRRGGAGPVRSIPLDRIRSISVSAVRPHRPAGLRGGAHAGTGLRAAERPGALRATGTRATAATGGWSECTRVIIWRACREKINRDWHYRGRAAARDLALNKLERQRAVALAGPGRPMAEAVARLENAGRCAPSRPSRAARGTRARPNAVQAQRPTADPSQRRPRPLDRRRVRGADGRLTAKPPQQRARPWARVRRAPSDNFSVGSSANANRCNLTLREMRKQRRRDMKERFGAGAPGGGAVGGAGCAAAAPALHRAPGIRGDTSAAALCSTAAGQFIHWWCTVVSLAFLYNLWVILFRVAFMEIEASTMKVWFPLDYTMDLIYLLDIAVSFRTGYLEDGVLQTDQSIVRAFRLCKVYKFFQFLDRTERHANYPNLIPLAEAGPLPHAHHPHQRLRAEAGWMSSTCSLCTGAAWPSSLMAEMPKPNALWHYVFVICEIVFCLLLFATVLGHVSNIVANTPAWPAATSQGESRVTRCSGGRELLPQTRCEALSQPRVRGSLNELPRPLGAAASTAAVLPASCSAVDVTRGPLPSSPVPLLSSEPLSYRPTPGGGGCLRSRVPTNPGSGPIARHHASGQILSHDDALAKCWGINSSRLPGLLRPRGSARWEGGGGRLAGKACTLSAKISAIRLEHPRRAGGGSSRVSGVAPSTQSCARRHIRKLSQAPPSFLAGFIAAN
uniref:Ion_trans domain-containing protein n=1 Tax=Macrostomum lignano TaxID=282301 RepID=A0A1I8F921_9PLAT